MDPTMNPTTSPVSSSPAGFPSTGPSQNSTSSPSTSPTFDFNTLDCKVASIGTGGAVNVSARPGQIDIKSQGPGLGGSEDQVAFVYRDPKLFVLGSGEVVNVTLEALVADLGSEACVAIRESLLAASKFVALCFLQGTDSSALMVQRKVNGEEPVTIGFANTETPVVLQISDNGIQVAPKITGAIINTAGQFTFIASVDVDFASGFLGYLVTSNGGGQANATFKGDLCNLPSLSPTMSPTTSNPTQPTLSPQTPSPLTISPSVAPSSAPTGDPVTLSPTQAPLHGTDAPATGAPSQSPRTRQPTMPGETFSPSQSPSIALNCVVENIPAGQAIGSATSLPSGLSTISQNGNLQVGQTLDKFTFIYDEARIWDAQSTAESVSIVLQSAMPIRFAKSCLMVRELSIVSDAAARFFAACYEFDTPAGHVEVLYRATVGAQTVRMSFVPVDTPIMLTVAQGVDGTFTGSFMKLDSELQLGAVNLPLFEAFVGYAVSSIDSINGDALSQFDGNLCGIIPPTISPTTPAPTLNPTQSPQTSNPSLSPFTVTPSTVAPATTSPVSQSPTVQLPTDAPSVRPTMVSGCVTVGVGGAMGSSTAFLTGLQARSDTANFAPQELSDQFVLVYKNSVDWDSSTNPTQKVNIKNAGSILGARSCVTVRQVAEDPSSLHFTACYNFDTPAGYVDVMYRELPSGPNVNVGFVPIDTPLSLVVSQTAGGEFSAVVRKGAAELVLAQRTIPGFTNGSVGYAVATVKDTSTSFTDYDGLLCDLVPPTVAPSSHAPSASPATAQPTTNPSLTLTSCSGTAIGTASGSVGAFPFPFQLNLFNVQGGGFKSTGNDDSIYFVHRAGWTSGEDVAVTLRSIKGIASADGELVDPGACGMVRASLGAQAPFFAVCSFLDRFFVFFRDNSGNVDAVRETSTRVALPAIIRISSSSDGFIGYVSPESDPSTLIRIGAGSFTIASGFAGYGVYSDSVDLSASTTIAEAVFNGRLCGVGVTASPSAAPTAAPTETFAPSPTAGPTCRSVTIVNYQMTGGRWLVVGGDQSQYTSPVARNFTFQSSSFNSEPGLTQTTQTGCGLLPART